MRRKSEYTGAMKLRIMSDVHLEFGKLRPPPVEADAVILAGDIGMGCEGFPWARQTFGDVPIVYVAGNHEFYGGRVVEDHYAAMRKSAAKHGVTFLQDDAVVIDDIRFLGATLWTDMALYGDPQIAALHATDPHRGINDFLGAIKGSDDRWQGNLTPEDFRFMHAKSRGFIAGELARGFAERTVVVTHHAPSEISVPPRHKGHALTPCYASSLEAMMLEHAPPLWIHGHVHESLDYMVGETRVVANPRGYVGLELNHNFEPDLVVELATEQAHNVA